MSLPSPTISVQNLTATYGDRTILKNISFDVIEGEVFCILGGSGSGKTTLLNHMIGLLTPSAGDVLIEGKSICKAFGLDRLQLLKKIGVMYQSGALFGSLNLFENVCLPLEELTDLPPEAIHRIALNKLNLVGLTKFSHFMPAQLSGGMQKRAAIARAMVLDPKILFLDEPSAGLDPITSANLDQLILTLSKTLGMTFVIVSHELRSIYTIAQRVILLHNGTIAAIGKPNELKDYPKDTYVRHFFDPTEIVTKEE